MEVLVVEVDHTRWEVLCSRFLLEGQNFSGPIGVGVGVIVGFCTIFIARALAVTFVFTTLLGTSGGGGVIVIVVVRRTVIEVRFY